MPNKRDIKLEEFDISQRRYRELFYFCLQYEEMKERLDDLYSLKSRQIHEKIQNNSILDLTQYKAIDAHKISKSLELIEQSALEADGDIYNYLLMNITNQLPYTYLRYSLDMPCGEKYFYNARKKFFLILDKKR